jgi:hypothetical protein
LAEQVASPDSTVSVRSLHSGRLINTSNDNRVASNPPGRLDGIPEGMAYNHRAPPPPGIMYQAPLPAAIMRQVPYELFLNQPPEYQPPALQPIPPIAQQQPAVQ